MKYLRITPELKITSLYMAIGGLWILLSDKLATLLFRNPTQLSSVQTYKGWFFVATTGLLLYYLIRNSRKHEKSLKQNYADIFESAEEGIFRSSPDGQFVLVNPAMAHMYGYASPEEMIESIQDINTQIHLSSESRERFITLLKEQGAVHRFEAENIKKDKTIIWTSTNAREVRGLGGKTKYYEGFVTDITKQKEAEIALQEAELLYRTLVEQMPAAAYTDSPDLSINFFTAPQILSMTGYSADEWKTDPNLWLRIIHPDDKLRVQVESRKTSKNGEAFNMEYRILTKNGQTIWIHDTASLIRDPSGNPKYWQGLFIDITSQKNAEETNKLSEARYHMLVEHASDGIIITDYTGKLIEINQQICTMLGYERNELLNKDLADLISREEIALRPLKLPEIHQGRTTTMERVFLRKNGSYISMELSSKTLPDGNFINIARDISNRRLLQETLTRSEKRFRSLIENSMDVIALYSPDGILLYQSPASVDILGYSLDELIGKSVFDIIVDEDKDEAFKVLASLLESPGRSIKTELRCRRKDGSIRWLDIIGTNRLNEPGIDALVANYRDITERKQAESVLERQLTELSILHSAALAESTSKTFDELLESVTEIISSALHPDNCGVLLFTGEDRRLKPHSSYYGIKNENILLRLPLNILTSEDVHLAGGETRIHEIVQCRSLFESSNEIHSNLCVPITVPSEIIGVLNIESKIKDAYTDADEKLLNTIAGGLANGIEKLRSFENEQKLHQRADRLREATASLTESLDIGTIYEKILSASAKLVDYTSASVEMINGKYAEIVAQRGLPENFEYLGKPYELEHEKWNDDIWTPVIISDVQKDDRFVKFPGTSYIHGWMGIPLIAQEKIVGFLNFDSDKVDFFTQEDAALMQTFANQAAIAVENSKHFDQEHRRARIIEAIADIANETTANLDTEDILDKIAGRARELLRANNVAIYLLQEDNQTIKVVTSHGTYSEELLSHTFKLGEGITGNLIAEGKAEIINLTSNDVRSMNIPGTPKDAGKIETMMTAPLLLHGRCIGSINVWRLISQGLFSQMELNFLISIAHQTSIALEVSHLLEETIKNAQETSAIAEVGRNISSTLQLDSVLERIAFHAKELLNAEASAIYLSQPGKNTLAAIAAIGQDADEIKNDPIQIGSGILGNIARQGYGEIVNNSENDPRMLVIKGTENRSYEHIMGVPIKSKELITGLLVVWRQGEKLEFRPSELDFLARLAQQAAIAIENAHLFESEQMRRRDAEILSQATGALADSLQISDLLETILDWLNMIVPYDSTSITLNNGGNYEIVASRGLPKQTDFSNVHFPINEKWQEIANSRRPLQIYDAQQDARFHKLEGTEYIRGWMGVPMFAQNSLIGFINLDSRTPGAFSNLEQAAAVQIFANQAATAIDKIRIFENLQFSNQELYLAYDITLEGWGKALELRDKETQGHTQRVTDMTLKLAKQMGISEADRINIRRGVLMHDIGKMGVPDNILHKDGPLTEAEMAEMKRHTQYAYDLIYPIAYLRPALDIAFNHHEWWNGNGYPRKLKGEEIPLAARIFAVVDVWDALLSDRPYRKAWPRKKVIQYINDLSGKQFDANVVTEFFKMINSEPDPQKKKSTKR